MIKIFKRKRVLVMGTGIMIVVMLMIFDNASYFIMMVMHNNTVTENC